MVVTYKTTRDGDQVVKPACVLDYNQHMGGVDRSDQIAKYYTFTRKTNKWWLKLFSKHGKPCCHQCIHTLQEERSRRQVDKAVFLKKNVCG